MALFNPSESPSVFVKETDLTGGVPNVQSSTGVYVGDFNWGPAEVPVLVSSDKDLAKRFSVQTKTKYVDFLSAAMFLKYSSSLYVTRMVTEDALNASTTITYSNVSGASDGAGTNATFDVITNTAGDTYVAAVVNGGTDYIVGEIITILGTDLGGVDGNSPIGNDLTITVDQVGVNGEIELITESGTPAESTFGKLIKNSNEFERSVNLPQFVAKYPGTLGNNLKIEIATSGISDPNWTAWDYENYFTAKPETGLVHAVIIDTTGAIAGGTEPQVLESFDNVSLTDGALTSTGSNNWIVDVINAKSSYVWMSSTSGISGDAVLSYTLYNGADSTALDRTDVYNGFALYEDPESYTVDFLILPSFSDGATQAALINDVAAVAEARKDCMLIASPARDDVLPTTSTTQSISETIVDSFSSVTRNKDYLFVDNNFFKVYDNKNDQYVYIPAAAGTAGLMAATDVNFAPWFSPAGQRRGGYLGVTALAYTPSKTDRDLLYKNSINPIANMPGQGVLLYGDKTYLSRASAFDRVNVRRLFFVLERAIAEYSRSILFEFNDEFTRAEFVNVVEPVLRNVQGRRGITDYKLICDETNNTPDVIDRNEFIANIFIKPARSINFITLNFVAVRTGVTFEEVVGTV